MKRKWGLVIGSILVMALLGAGTAWAGQFTSPADKAKVADINKRLAAEKTAIAKKYEQQDMERQAAVRAAAVKPATDEGRGFPRPVKAVVKAFFTFVPSVMVGVYEGVKYIGSSKLENPLSRFCRGVNVGLDQVFGNTMGCAREFVTPWETTEYADPSQLNFIAKETITWGPLAQMLRTGASAAAPACAATGVLGPVAGMCYGGTVATLATTNTAGGYLVGKGVDMAEKAVSK